MIQFSFKQQVNFLVVISIYRNGIELFKNYY